MMVLVSDGSAIHANETGVVREKPDLIGKVIFPCGCGSLYGGRQSVENWQWQSQGKMKLYRSAGSCVKLLRVWA
jgi:hypothetical protein